VRGLDFSLLYGELYNAVIDESDVSDMLHGRLTSGLEDYKNVSLRDKDKIR